MFAVAGELATASSLFIPKVADLADPAKVQRLFTEVEEELDGLDALVNNAGTCIDTDSLEISPEELRRQMTINFESAFYCCHQAVPLMLRRPGIKKIVSSSSNGTYDFGVFDPAYCRASKAAMDNLTKHLALAMLAKASPSTLLPRCHEARRSL